VPAGQAGYARQGCGTMHEREPTSMKRLLDRLLSVRARRDREQRFSDGWLAADAELHAIERAIFRVPIEGEAQARTRDQTGQDGQNGDIAAGDPASLSRHRQARDAARAAAAAEPADGVSRTDRDDRGSHHAYEGERAG